MDQGALSEDAVSRAERRKRDPIGQILDFLSNSNKNKSSVSSSPTEKSNGTLNKSSCFPLQQEKHFMRKQSAAKCFTNQPVQGSVSFDDGSAFKPFCKNVEESTREINGINNQCFLQKGFPCLNNYTNWQINAAHNVTFPITATSLYRIQYPTIPTTVSHNAFPKVCYAFPQNLGFYPNLDVSGNSMFSWMDRKIATESNFNPECILNSENTGTHVTPAPPRYQCDSCKKSYSTYGGLSKHKQFHCVNHVKKEFSCKFCGKCYGSLGALKMHIRTHTLPCKCKICGKAFSRPWLLQGHIRTHTGEKPFRCDHCSRAFADRSNLRAHLQTHSEIKKYGCKNCSKTFSRMSLLVKHKENHCYR